MGIATYNSPAQRIGQIKGQIWKHAVHTSTVEMTGEVWKQPVKMGDTVVFRQVVPFGATAAAPNVFSTTAAAHLIQEGNNPNPDSLTTVDTSVTVQKYGATYGYTERTASLGEDDVPQWMEQQLGERLGLVRELVYLGALDAGTNRFYSGGTTRLTVDESVTENLLGRVTRSIENSHGKPMRSVMKSSADYGTVALQAAYLAFGHTDLRQNIEALPGYKAVCDYGQAKPVHELEIGAVGTSRFILSPDMPKVADAGAAIAGTTNYSTTGTDADVYKLFVIAKDAWGHTAFRGLDAFKYMHKKVNDIDSGDPTGERGYCSATFYDAGIVSNHGWMAVCECTVKALT